MINFDDVILDQMIELFGEKEINDALLEGDLTKYQKDPISFFKEVLGVKHIYDDLIKVCDSIVQNKITIAQSSNGVGKTWLLAHLSIWRYLCFPDSQIILMAAPPEANLREKAFSEVLDIIYKNKKLFKEHVVTTLKVMPKMSLKSDNDEEGSNKHFIVGKSIPSAGTDDEKKAKVSGAHAPNMFVGVDEANGVPNAIFEALEGVLVSEDARLFCTLNPRAKIGSCWEMTKNGTANVIILSSFNHPNVTTGTEVIPGAVSQNKVVERLNLWSKPLNPDEEADSNCFEVPEWLVGQVSNSGSGKQFEPIEPGWRRITNPAFATVCLGTYPSSTENSLIDEKDIDAAVSRWKLYTAQYGKDATKGISCLLAMDVADEGGDSNSVCLRYGNYIAGFRTWKGIDIDKSIDKVSQIYVDTDSSQINVEADGIGAAIPPKLSRTYYWKCENKECEHVNKTYLDEKIYQCPVCHKDMARKHISARKVYVSSPSNQKCEFGKFHLVRDQLAWAVAEWLKKEQSAMLPDDPELREELLCYQFWEDPSSGKIKVSDKKMIKKAIGRSDDKFASLRQAFYEPKNLSIRIV